MGTILVSHWLILHCNYYITSICRNYSNINHHVYNYFVNGIGVIKCYITESICSALLYQICIHYMYIPIPTISSLPCFIQFQLPHKHHWVV